MTKAELKSQFQNSYNRESWKPILKLVFGQINYFTDPFSLFEGVETVKQGYQIGYVDLPNNQTVAIFEIEVADSIIIERNRKGLRDIAEKFINGTFTAALVFYYSKNQTEYRFSFIAKQSKIDEQTGEHSTIVTAPKRYTYVLGTPFCTTAAERWIKLAAEPEINVDKITDAFSVETLSKEFFDQYKIQYTRFCKFIADDATLLQQFIDHAETDSDKAQKPLRDYVKKLLGRLVFLQFLQKKGWMGVPAANNDWKGGDLNFMANLFNKSPYQDNFLDAVLEPLFFNTLNAERTNDIAVDIDNNIKIPYLNGGLFEKTSLDNTKVQFPKNYFCELFEFFNQYNFTIDENDPDDAEVGIDPEMLGHIFENLLEDNKDKGAFYTPKEIVRYMCQESLIAYLHTHTPEALHLSVEKLIRTHKVDDCLQDKPNATLIQKLLVAVKICDPAIGSGAFPMGMLNEIFMVRRLLFGFLGKNQSFSACLVKKEIIQNNIYGVDIEQGAVDIARLRFWLALVVDEDVPQALPNLDYKIVCGNSLISRFALDCDINEVFKEYNKTEEGKKEPLTLQRYKDEVANYTDEHTNKATQKNKIEAIKSAFKMYLSFGDRIQIKKLAKKVVSYDGLFGVQEIDLKDAKLKEAYVKNEELKTQLSNLQNQQQEVLNNKIYENSFEWRFEFPSLLDDIGNFVGFDVVIGNPPYFNIQTLGAKSSIVEKIKNQYPDIWMDKSDILFYFIKVGIELSKKSSDVCFIISNAFLFSDKAQKLRNFIIQKAPIQDIVNFERYSVFESAMITTAIVRFKKGMTNSVINALNITENIKGDFKSIVNNKENYIKVNVKLNSVFPLVNKTTEDLNNKIDENKILLGELALVGKGMETAANDVFCNNEIKNNNFPIQYIKRRLHGKGIKRYTIDNSHTEDMIYFENINSFEELPENIQNYLIVHKDKLLNRATVKNEGRPWWRYSRPMHKDYYELDKIWTSYRSSFNCFAFDDTKKYIGLTNTTVIFNTNSSIVSLKYLLALLNSKLLDYRYKSIGKQTGGGIYEYFENGISKLPIPLIGTHEQLIFISLIDRILDLKKENSQSDTTTLEQQIDLLVYKLYELSYDEVLLIEPDFGKRVSVEEYEKVVVE